MLIDWFYVIFGKSKFRNLEIKIEMLRYFHKIFLIKLVDALDDAFRFWFLRIFHFIAVDISLYKDEDQLKDIEKKKKQAAKKAAKPPKEPKAKKPPKAKATKSPKAAKTVKKAKVREIA